MANRYSNVDKVIAIDPKTNEVKETLGVREVSRSPISTDGVSHVVSVGDDCFRLALKYYGDAKLWYLIADINKDVEDPLNLKIGSVVFVPRIGR